MIKNKIEKWVSEWYAEDPNSDVKRINKLLIFLSEKLYSDYEAYSGPSDEFFIRLENWLENLEDQEDRKTFFKLLPHIFYVSQKEFVSLYRVAYHEIIANWILKLESIGFDEPIVEMSRLINRSLEKSWICAITESMKINSFYKINGIPGTRDLRPHWYELQKLGDRSKIISQIKKEGIDKIIMIEDFVGSGSQIIGSINYALDLNLKIPILIIPLIICPDGVKNLQELASRNKYLTIKPVLNINSSSLVDRNDRVNEPEIYKKLRETIIRVYLKTSGGINPGAKKPYSPFGYRDTGGLIVLYSNTPDNSIPALHWESDTWVPLFKRQSRN